MRFVSLFAILASTALSGCVGGDGSALSLAASGVAICGVNDPNCATPAPSPTPTTPPVVVPPGPTTTPPITPTIPSTNTGNAVSLTTGDTTIALENGNFILPKGKVSLSKLTTTAATASAPATAKFEIDTKTDTNSLWPIAKTMNEFVSGTNASNGLGFGGSTLGGTYKEYRAYTKDKTGKGVDEELQVWSFGNSYATQYRDVTDGGGPAVRQAWSFGGTKTPSAAMTLKGSGQYIGRFGATARTAGFINRNGVIVDNNGFIVDVQGVDNNNDWRLWGNSDLNANFLTGSFDGTLTPVEWDAFATMNGRTGFTRVLANDTADLNWVGFMDNDIALKGTITNGTATTGNSIAGTSSFDSNPGWLTNTTTNSMYASTYGANADEITGAFGFDATLVSPIGGDIPINGDRRAYITMSGVFNGVAQ
jgi:hypothetical protein